MRRRHRLRLGRASLAEEDGEHDDRADGEELALPVLEGLEPEPRRTGVLQSGYRLAAVEELLGAVGLRTASRVEIEGDEEEESENEDMATDNDDEEDSDKSPIDEMGDS